MNIRRAVVFWLVGVCAVLACPWYALAGTVGDYGDAPDPTFPSLYASLGVHHVDVSKEWIGAGLTSTTTVEPDAWPANGDVDDGYGWWVRETDIFGQAKTWFITRASYDPTLSTADEARYLNVLLDVDGSGSWDGGNEWAVQNERVHFETLPAGVNGIYVVVRVPDAIDPANLANSWTRVTLGDSEVPDGSGAWAEMARGETEDWIGAMAQPGGPPAPDKAKPALRIIPLAGWGACPHNFPGICTPLCPPPPAAPVVNYDLWVPPGTTSLKVRIDSTGPWCGICAPLCNDHSDVLHTGSGANPVIPGVWSAGLDQGKGQELIGTGIDLGAVNDFWGFYSFDSDAVREKGGGHDAVKFSYQIQYDPAGDYYQITDPAYLDDGYSQFYAVPEPATMLVSVLGLISLGRYVRRRFRS
ncbi:MAG TPA: PEP-CTERM sorting domain-containing protein [Phycisphaerae bacterium]|nr:PEP-CTERM sorting domain-containing protein [Phycisphaerae bacterium]